VSTSGPKKLNTEKVLARQTELVIATAVCKTETEPLWEPTTVDDFYQKMYASVCVPGATYSVKLGNEQHGDGFFSNPLPIDAVAAYEPMHVLLIVNVRVKCDNVYSMMDRFAYVWLYRYCVGASCASNASVSTFGVQQVTTGCHIAHWSIEERYCQL